MNPSDSNIDRIFDLLTQTSNVRTFTDILTDIYHEHPEFKTNQNIQKMEILLSNSAKMKEIPPHIKDQLITLFSQAISETSATSLEQLASTTMQSTFSTQQLIQLEKQLLASISEEEKLHILSIFREKQAIPDPDILSKLLTETNHSRLKKNIILTFGTYIPRNYFLKLLEDKYLDLELHAIAIQVSGNRHDIPMHIFERIIQDRQEDIHNRILTLEIYNTVIDPHFFVNLISNKTESIKLRLLAIKKASIRFDIPIEFIETILNDPTEHLNLKKSFFISFKLRIPLDDIRRYLLNKSIPVEEKYEILKLIKDRYKELNTNGTLDMTLLLMKEYAKGRKLLLESKHISEMCIKQLLFDPTCADEFKIDILTYCATELSKKNYKLLFEELVKNTETPFLFRIQILTDFKQAISFETILMIIRNKDEIVDFRIAVMDRFKETIRNLKAEKHLEKIISDQDEPLLVKNYALKYFHKGFSEETVITFLLAQDIEKPTIQKLLLSLKNVHFLQPQSLFFKKVLNRSITPETAQFLFDQFQEYFNGEQLYLIFLKLPKTLPLPDFIDSINSTETKTRLTEYVLKDPRSLIDQKKYLLSHFWMDLSGLLLSNLMTDPDYPNEIKQFILTLMPKRLDINDGGELGFIFSDPDEPADLRLAIYQNYRDCLNDSMIRSVQQNAHESADFLKKLTV